MGYYDNDTSFLERLAFGALMAGLVGIGWLAVQGWHWVVAWWAR
jgi:hypothetical protein